MIRFLLFFLVGLFSAAQVPFEAEFRAVAGPRWIDRAAQVKAESLFRADITAADGGMGLGQMMPRTWVWIQGQGWVPKGASAYDPHWAIVGQNAYMVWQEARTESYNAALGAYNAGLGNVRKAQRLAEQLGLAGRDAWLEALPRVTGPRNGAITRAYIARNRKYRIEMGSRS